jgi:Concanavalin A-like lectin/glucanases superfamily
MFVGIKYVYNYIDNVRAYVTNLITSFLSRAGYGYNIDRGQVNRILSVYDRNGGIPDLLYDAGLSVNYNLFTATATLSTQTLTLPLGTFIFGFASGAGSITSSNGTGTATGHGTATLGVNDTFFVNVAGTFTFTVSGTVNNAQLNVGSTLFSYRARVDATTVKCLNLGNVANIGDGTYVNGSTIDMFAFDAASGNTNTINSVLSQRVNTNYLPTLANLTWMGWVKPTTLKNQVLFWNGGSSTARLSLQLMNNGNIGFGNNNTITQSSGTTYSTGIWQHVALVKNGDVHQLYLNAVQIYNGSVTSTATAGTGLIIGADTGNGDYIDGNIDKLACISSSLTLSQIQTIYNAHKSQFAVTLAGSLIAKWDAASIAQSNMSSVASWLDSSGSGYNLSQATMASQPLYITGGLNGLPAVRFNGVSTVMTNASITLPSKHTIFVVYSNYTTGGSFYSTNSANGPLQRITQIFFDGNASAISVTSQVSKKLLTCAFDYVADVYNVYQDKVLVGTLATLGNVNGSTINVGARQASEFVACDISEIRIYNRVLSASELTTVHTELSTKYNI